MANKRESLKLDSKASVSCPYCGNGNRINDLLFRTSKRLPIAEDNRLSDYCYRFHNPIPRGYNVPAGWTEPRRLISWVDLPNSKVLVKDGLVTAVEDNDGEKAEERACIWCHNKISEEWISRAGREIALFSQPGGEETAVAFVEKLIRDNVNARKELDEFRCFVSGNNIFYTCVSIDELDIERRKRTLLGGLASKAAIFFLKLGDQYGNDIMLDLETIEWLNAGISKVYGTSVVECPTMVVLIPLPGDKVGDVEKTHQVLCARLQVHFNNYRVYLWQSAEQLVQDFTEAEEWLINSK